MIAPLPKAVFEKALAIIAQAEAHGGDLSGADELLREIAWEARAAVAAHGTPLTRATASPIAAGRDRSRAASGVRALADPTSHYVAGFLGLSSLS